MLKNNKHAHGALGAGGNEYFEYTYDVLGRRVGKKFTVNGGSTFALNETYFYDGNDVICDLLPRIPSD